MASSKVLLLALVISICSTNGKAETEVVIMRGDDGSIEGSGGEGSGMQEGSGEGGWEEVNLVPPEAGRDEKADLVMVVLLGSRRKITMTRRLYEKQQWIFNRADGTTCVPLLPCFNDNDCGGSSSGRCSGFGVHKCNCDACSSFAPCEDDSSCGGLIGACNKSTKMCDCDQGFKSNGIRGGLFGALFGSFCNRRTCTPDSNSCFGLPCKKGLCCCF